MTGPSGSRVAETLFCCVQTNLLALLQVGRHVNSGEFSTCYDEQKFLLGTTIGAPVLFDTLSASYFKFNLDYMTFYNLVRMEGSSFRSVYTSAYQIARDHSASHLNAFFDIVDRELNGANAGRGGETRMLLDQWLQRPRQNFFVDLTKSVAVCGGHACQPIPVALRAPADFLWQVSPFQLTGGGTDNGSGIIEDNGIDYILPYWMARYCGVITSLTAQSAAATSSALAPNSLASLYGSALASETAQATSLPLPTVLGGISVTVTDTHGASRLAPLIFAAPEQVNFVVPDGTAAGTATIAVNNTFTTEAILNVATGATYLTLYGTGIRNRTALSMVQVNLNGMSVSATFAGAQPGFTGLDQVNVLLPASLAGSGVTNLMLTVDEQPANVVTIQIK